MIFLKIVLGANNQWEEEEILSHYHEGSTTTQANINEHHDSNFIFNNSF